MPQLDSLRAIAVILVIISHWFAREHFFNRYSDNGILGVTLFFVLSGFLITGILLKSKIVIERGGSKKKAFGTFYVRRSLRIFPVYYLLLLMLLVFNLANVRESFWWHFFYGSNFFFWLQDKFGGSLSHLWSLSVEEQFYLFWPVVIIFIARKYIPYALLTGILIAILFRYFITNPQNELGRLLMPGSLDSFCIGGLLAYGRQFGPSLYHTYITKRNWLIVISFLLLIFVHTSLFENITVDVRAGLFYFLISVAFGILIDRVADSVNTPVIRILLNNRALLFIGKISYGLYLFHNFIPYFYDINLPVFLQPFSLYLVQAIRFLLLIGLASVSWFLFEKPILKLKERFVFSSQKTRFSGDPILNISS